MTTAVSEPQANPACRVREPAMFECPVECPHCEGTIPRDDFAREELPENVVTYMYCEFCGLGRETLWLKVGGSLRHLFDIPYSRADKPEELGKFRQRLYDRRSASQTPAPMFCG